MAYKGWILGSRGPLFFYAKMIMFLPLPALEVYRHAVVRLCIYISRHFTYSDKRQCNTITEVFVAQKALGRFLAISDVQTYEQNNCAIN